MDYPLAKWADEVVVMDSRIEAQVKDCDPDAVVVNLNIPDEYAYADPALEALIMLNYKKQESNDPE